MYSIKFRRGEGCEFKFGVDIGHERSGHGYGLSLIHIFINGLGSAVAEVVAEHGGGRMKRMGVQDQFGESGPYYELLKKNGITAENIAKAAAELCGKCRK